jgi:hypothetical protein
MTQVALLTAQVDLRNLVTLPRVAQALFGSALAISGEGVLGLAVAGRDGSDGLTVGVYQSVDGMHWRFSLAGSARAEPDEFAGSGGAVLSVPGLAGLSHGFAAAWTDTTEGTARTRIARNDTGVCGRLASPPAQVPRLQPTLAAADDALVLIQAGLSPAGLTSIPGSNSDPRGPPLPQTLELVHRMCRNSASYSGSRSALTAVAPRRFRSSLRAPLLCW